VGKREIEKKELKLGGAYHGEVQLDFKNPPEWMKNPKAKLYMRKRHDGSYNGEFDKRPKLDDLKFPRTKQECNGYWKALRKGGTFKTKYKSKFIPTYKQHQQTVI